MQTENLLENQTDFLLRAALRKCGDIETARDLAQESLLAALSYQKRGGKIEDIRAWLLAVMSRRYYDCLRKKYKLPTVTISDGFEPADETDLSDAAITADEAQAVRREVSYLSGIYRQITARHYFHDESVAKIAAELGIPAGTVKSRLFYARSEMKRGLEKMEGYCENSYMPQKLYVRNSGGSGINGEPMSLVSDDDILTQNLLLLAYEKPVFVSELAKVIGIPAAYIEPVVNKLLSGELIKKTGDGRVYTDFIIYDPDDDYKHIREQEKFASENAGVICGAFKRAVGEMKDAGIHSERLERYMLINIAARALYESLSPHIRPQVFPDRPNGGSWIAFGRRVPEGYSVPESMRGRESYSLSGERSVCLDEYLGSQKPALYNYESNLYGISKYDGFGYEHYSEMESDVLRLFCLIKKGVPPESVGFTPKMLKNMPLMAQRGMIGFENGEPKHLVPCLTHAQNDVFRKICREAIDKTAASLSEPMGVFIKGRKKRIPPHLKSVPDQKLLMPFTPSPMVFVFEAISRGLHKRDLGYVCPETYAVID